MLRSRAHFQLFFLCLALLAGCAIEGPSEAGAGFTQSASLTGCTNCQQVHLIFPQALHCSTDQYEYIRVELSIDNVDPNSMVTIEVLAKIANTDAIVSYKTMSVPSNQPLSLMLFDKDNNIEEIIVRLPKDVTLSLNSEKAANNTNRCYTIDPDLVETTLSQVNETWSYTLQPTAHQSVIHPKQDSLQLEVSETCTSNQYQVFEYQATLQLPLTTKLTNQLSTNASPEPEVIEGFEYRAGSAAAGVLTNDPPQTLRTLSQDAESLLFLGNWNYSLRKIIRGDVGISKFQIVSIDGKEDLDGTWVTPNHNAIESFCVASGNAIENLLLGVATYYY